VVENTTGCQKDGSAVSDVFKIHTGSQVIDSSYRRKFM